MTKKATAVTKTEAVELDMLEAALAGLDKADTSSEADVASAVAAVEMEEANAEAYADQEAAETPAEVEAAPAEKPAKEKKPPRETSMATSKKSDVIRERLGDNLAGTLVLEMADAELSKTKLKNQQDKILDMIDGLAKKVGEKAVNLIAHLNGSAKLSAYSEIALKFLNASPEGIVAADLIAHYQDQKANGVKSYSVGTARSQGHQMFQLLPALKIAEMTGKTMTVNPDSLIAAVIIEKL